MPWHRFPPTTYGRTAVYHCDVGYLFVRRHEKDWTEWRDTEELKAYSTTPTEVGYLRADDLFISAPHLAYQFYTSFDA